MRRVYQKLIREYEAERAGAEARAIKQRTEAYEKIPRLLEIDSALGVIGAKIARLALSGDADGIAEARAESERLREERNSLYIESKPEYRCKICSDTGHIKTSPGAVPVECSCFKQRLISEYYNISNLEEVLHRENFGTFKVDLFSKEICKNEEMSAYAGILENRKFAQEFVSNFDKSFSNLLLIGSTGLGKTFMCHCIAKKLLDKGFTVLYQTATRLCSFLEDYRFNREDLDDPGEMYKTIDEVDLLIIDDLGSEMVTIVTSSALFDIINQRLLTRRSTVISTNLSWKELQDTYTERIYSRILGNFDKLSFYGEDLRAMKRYKNVHI